MSLCHTTTTTTTTTTETTKRWYALVRMDEDGRSVAPQAEEIAKLERELMRQSGHPNEEGQVASEEMFLHTNYHSGRNTNARATQKKTKTLMVQDENDTSATSAKQATRGAPSRLGQKRGHAANSDGTESAKEGSTSPSTASETIMTSENKSSPPNSSKKRKKETSAKEKKKESHGGTATTTNAASPAANYTNNRGGAESARGTNTNATTREVPPGCKPGGPCDHCGALDSPQWRRGPASKPCLCNACGTRFRRTNFLAPVANNNNNNNNNKDNNKQDNGEDNNGSTGGVNKRNLDMDGQSTKKRSVAAAC